MSFHSDDEDAGQNKPHINYQDEDTSATTDRELNGWYAYSIAAEVFAVVAVGAFLPVILEQLARENGHFFSDSTKNCVNHGNAGSVRMTAKGQSPTDQCMVSLLDKTISTSSFAMYTFSAAVMVQAITLVFEFICRLWRKANVVAEGPYRKKMLIAFAYMGSIASALFIFISPTLYLLAPILVIIGFTSLGCSFVLLNAFLPLLIANYADGSGARVAFPGSSSDFELEALNPEAYGLGITQRDPESLARDLERSAQISSRGVANGYIAAVFVQVTSILILWLFSKTTIQERHPSLPIRVILFLVGLWWATVTTPTLLWLRPRPGPPLPSPDLHASADPPSRLRTLWFYTRFSLRSFLRTLVCAISLRQTLRFFAAWFLLSDAVATISGTAILFARTELHMGTIAVALLSITSISSGIIGAVIWPRIQKHFSLQPKTVLLCCIAGMEIIPLYGLLGFIPFFRNLGFIGLQKPWEIYVVAVLHGSVMGGISSYARSVYAPLIPEGKEAAFFALYAVTDKGSSAFGPAFVGWIVDQTGSIRPAFIFLAVLVVLPAPLLWWLDVERGREDAEAIEDGHGRSRSGSLRGE